MNIWCVGMAKPADEQHFAGRDDKPGYASGCAVLRPEHFRRAILHFRLRAVWQLSEKQFSEHLRASVACGARVIYVVVGLWNSVEK